MMPRDPGKQDYLLIYQILNFIVEPKEFMLGYIPITIQLPGASKAFEILTLRYLMQFKVNFIDDKTREIYSSYDILSPFF